MKNVFVWVDIPVTDIDRATAFYSAVHGEDVARMDVPGFHFSVFASQPGEVSGTLYVPHTHANAPSDTGPLVYLNVDGRIDAALAAVEAHGGRVVQPPGPIGAHGFRAIVIDSEGNLLALHSMSM